MIAFFKGLGCTGVVSLGSPVTEIMGNKLLNVNRELVSNCKGALFGI